MTRFVVSKVLVGLALSFGMSMHATAVGFGGFFNYLPGQAEGENIDLDQALVKMSERMNRNMPQSVDKDTRLESVSAEPGKRFAYNYTMLNQRSKDIDTAGFYRNFRPTLQKRVCASPELQVFFRNRITLAFAYRGMDGQDIGKLAFAPKDCGYPG